MTEAKPQDTLTPVTLSGSVICVKFEGGVMMAADTMVCSGSMLAHPNCERIYPLGNRMLFTGTGEHSDLQELVMTLESIERSDRLRLKPYKKSVDAYHSLLTRILYQKRNKMDPLYGTFVVAGVKPGGESYIGVSDLWGTDYSCDYLATGVGHYFVLPWLANSWRPNLSEEQARELCLAAQSILVARQKGASCNLQISVVYDGGKVVNKGVERVQANWGHDQFYVPSKDFDLTQWPC